MRHLDYLDRDPGVALRGRAVKGLLIKRSVVVGLVVLGAALSGPSHAQTAVPESAVRRVVDDLTDAHLAALQAVRPGMDQQVIWDALTLAFRRLGLAGGFSVWSQQSSLGSSPLVLDNGDLLGVMVTSDASLSAQVSRTYPVGGQFSPEQRDIYRIAREALQAGIRIARGGVGRSDVEAEVRRVSREELLTLGLITDDRADQYEEWHSDFTGLIVDERPPDPEIKRLLAIPDPTPAQFEELDRLLLLARAWTLQPGMTFWIRVRISIGDNRLTDLIEAGALPEEVRRYTGIDVTLGDSYLLTPSGAERLSSRLPLEMHEVEDITRNGP